MRESSVIKQIIIPIIVYRLLLDIAYFQILSPLYSYMGFNDYGTAKLCIISWILVFASIPFISFLWKEERGHGSFFVVLLLYLLSFLPFTTCVYAGIISAGSIIGNVMYWFFLIFFFKIMCKDAREKQISIRFKNIKFNEKILYIFLLLALSIIIFVSYHYTNFRIITDLDSVYKYRNEAKNYGLPLIAKYFFSMIKVALAILWGYFIYARKWIGAGIVLVLQALNFGVDGSKSILFNTFLVGVIVFLGRNSSVNKIKLLICKLFVGLISLGILENWIIGTYWILGRIVRRLLFVPSFLHEVYYDFFSVHEVDLFRSSFLRWFGYISPYSSKGGIAQVIGEYMGTHSHANNGLFSDAMANLGLAGIVVMPLAVVLFLRLFDICTVHLNRGLVAATAFPIALSLMSSPLGTILLTHGGLLVLFLMMLMRRVSRPNGKAEVRIHGG